MTLDPVLAEVRAVREAYAERFGGDVKSMLGDIRTRQQQSSRPSVTRPPKRMADKILTPRRKGAETTGFGSSD
jgi:hypothetical protein